jgi:YVTN family beta-propeller protein
MSDTQRTERALREWFADSDHPLPADRVASAILDAIPAIGQDSGARSAVVAGRLTRALAAIAAAVAVVVGAVFLTRGTGPSMVAGSPTPAPSVSVPPSASPPAATPFSAVPGVTVIDMGAPTWALAVNAESAWVQVGDVGMGRIDRATNRDTGIRVNEVPQMQFEGSKLWALEIGTGIVQVDPLTGTILRTISGISGFYLVVDGTTAWVTNTGHSLDRVDLATGKVVATIDVPATPKEMAIFAGSVWVACDDGGSVARVDIATNKVVATIPAGSRPVNVAVGEGAVWVWNHERQLLRIDPATNKVVATIDGVSETLGVGVAVGGGFVWVAMPGGIGKVDPATNTVVDVIPIGGGGYVDFVWFEDELWASSTDRNYVYRIDPSA